MGQIDRCLAKCTWYKTAVVVYMPDDDKRGKKLSLLNPKCLLQPNTNRSNAVALPGQPSGERHVQREVLVLVPGIEKTESGCLFPDHHSVDCPKPLQAARTHYARRAGQRPVACEDFTLDSRCLKRHSMIKRVYDMIPKTKGNTAQSHLTKEARRQQQPSIPPMQCLES